MFAVEMTELCQAGVDAGGITLIPTQFRHTCSLYTTDPNGHNT